MPPCLPLNNSCGDPLSSSSPTGNDCGQKCDLLTSLTLKPSRTLENEDLNDPPAEFWVPFIPERHTTRSSTRTGAEVIRMQDHGLMVKPHQTRKLWTLELGSDLGCLTLKLPQIQEKARPDR